MRYFFLLIFFSLANYSQTNQAVINKAVNAAKSQNITSKSQVVEALRSRGISEAQAREIARQKGIDYQQLLNQYFAEDLTGNKNDINDPDTSLLQNQKEINLSDGESSLKNTDETKNSIKNQDTILSLEKKYFGYEIFKNNPYLNKEYLLGNIDEGYLISPGDEIRIIIYGDNSLELKVKVDRNGNININDFGIFFAAGMTFKTLKSRLKIYLGKYISGLVTDPQKTFMDVSLTELKPTKVVVLGQVESPGPHILTTSGSALSALYAAGGVKNNGSLREIIIYRNNKVLKKIDLYDYITTGELKDDIKLTNNDIVFVPNRKNSIELKGEVQTSAIYELLKNEDLKSLISFSGGLLSTTQTKKVNIRRIIPPKERTTNNPFDRKLITIDYQTLLNKNEKIELFDGDQVTFFRILDLESDQVTISGHVFEPGTYSLTAFPTLNDLIFNAAKGFMPDVYFEKVDVYSKFDDTRYLNSYSLTEIISENSQVNLSDGDIVILYDKSKIEGERSVSISGFGTRSSTIEWKENFSLYDIIFDYTEIENPEFTNKVLDSRIDLKRYNIETGSYFTIKFNFNNIVNLKETKLLPKDKVRLYGLNAINNMDKKVVISGFVKKPFFYELEENMYVEDLILLSGGFQIEADQNQVTLNRPVTNFENERIVTKFEIEVDKEYLLGNKAQPKNKFKLEDQDIIVVKKKKGFEKPSIIFVSGEVNNEQSVILEYSRSNFSEILNSVNGLTKYANLEASVLKRKGEIISIDFNKINRNERIFLDGDEIFIASDKGFVRTLGAVQNESNFIWKKNYRAKKYINFSGGKLSDGRKSYLLYPNGKSKSIGFLKNPKVLPNSTIIVNKKVKIERERGQFLQDFNTTFGIIASTLTAILITTKL
tara:strand:+ start:1475 stop:4123 length:2649 start_codon:yes stop_codon:yes gene_type:complete